jgi:hypothetical protein
MLGRMGLPACQGYHHSEHTLNRSGRGIPSSKHRKLAQGKAAAEVSRRDYKIQVGGHNSGNPWDFGAREPQRATGKSPMVERRTSVNRSPCGRRTSLRPARLNARRLADSIPGDGRMFYREVTNNGNGQYPTTKPLRSRPKKSGADKFTAGGSIYAVSANSGPNNFIGGLE